MGRASKYFTLHSSYSLSCHKDWHLIGCSFQVNLRNKKTLLLTTVFQVLPKKHYLIPTHTHKKATAAHFQNCYLSLVNSTYILLKITFTCPLGIIPLLSQRKYWMQSSVRTGSSWKVRRQWGLFLEVRPRKKELVISPISLPSPQASDAPYQTQAVANYWCRIERFTLTRLLSWCGWGLFGILSWIELIKVYQEKLSC